MLHGIVSRTTLLILFFAGLVGALVALGSTVVVAQEERKRLQQNVTDLIQSVERTASVAAFARDEQLAAEVAQGLLGNRSVHKVVIREGNRVMIELGHETARSGRALPVQVRPLMSPFMPEQQVGEIEVWPAAHRIDEDAGAYSRFIAVILGMQLVAVALAAAWVVLNVITRPVKTLSDSLHSLRAGSGDRVPVPAGHSGDEIGRLAGDINGLIVRMEGMLDSERELRAQREESEKRFRLIFEAAQTGMFTLDAEGCMHNWNPWLARTLGLPACNEDTEPYSLRRLLGPEASRLDALMVRALSDHRPAAADFQTTSAHGHVLWLHLVLNPMSGQLLQGIVNDVTDQKRAEASAIAMAERDALTGLLNRRGIEHRLDQALDGLQEGGLALMLVDLDGFKEVNDTLGHEAGDRVLTAVARQLESIVRRSDVVARLGGDEFIVVLGALDSPDTARFIAAKIVTSLARPIELDGAVHARIGASVGIAYTRTRDEMPDALMRRADEAMYEAKRAGKSQYRFAS